MGNKIRKNKIIKVGVIVLVLAFLLMIFIFALTEVKKADSLANGYNSNTVFSFYAEEQNSLDGIFLGSSAANRYWISARAFELGGICVYNLGTKLQPFVTTKYLIKEALKTQPNMKFIFIETRCSVRPAKYTGDCYIKNITDIMPYSENRNDMIKATLGFFDEAGGDIDFNSADYYFPAVRKKGKWLKNFEISNLKLLHDDNYLSIDKGYSMLFNTTELKGPIEYTEREPIDAPYEKVLDDLLEYCKTIEQEVIFVSAPYESNYGWESKLRYVLDKCEHAGFSTLDFNSEPLQGEIGLDWSTDFADYKHLNTYGAVKYTDYLTKYLADNYELEDHREETGYESWHKAVKHLNSELNAN